MKNAIDREELNTYLQNLDAALKDDIENIEHFSRKDLVRLEKSIIISLHNLKKYDSKTLKVSKRLASMYEHRDNLINQSMITKDAILEDILPKLEFKIMPDILLAMLLSSDIYDFIKKFSLIVAIDYLTFRISLLYTTSDSKKEITKNRLDKLEASIANEEFNYLLYKKIDNCFSIKLDLQYQKLLELYPEINEEDIKVKRRKQK